MDKTVEPMTDDAELAKVLDSMQDGSAAPAVAPSGLNFEETPAAPATAPAATTTDGTQPIAPVATPAEPVLSIPDLTTATSTAGVADPALESIKKDALAQLRPLVDKLDLPADEKFDTLLLIIRSTDDKTLVQTAYEAAKNITDESKRAEALLDIVKEIDYFANPSAGQPEL